MVKQDTKFMAVVADAGVIANTATAHLNLEALKTEFGNNFNTLVIVNNSGEEISVTLNGRKHAYINSGGGSLTLDWEDGIIFDDIQITNEHATQSTAANEIRVTVGRTGV
jgi:hypothetical protein